MLALHFTSWVSLVLKNLGTAMVIGVNLFYFFAFGHYLRRWIQAVFCNRSLDQMHENMSITDKFLNNYDDTEVDVSDSIADMFGMSPPADEVTL